LKTEAKDSNPETTKNEAATCDLTPYGLHVKTVLRRPSPARCSEEAILYDENTAISDTGALIAYSGEKTDRSPQDKRIVRYSASEDDVWWGPVNVALDEQVFQNNRERAKDYLNTRERLYVVDGFAGWDVSHCLKIRVISSRPYHALFMQTMIIRPAPGELSRVEASAPVRASSFTTPAPLLTRSIAVRSAPCRPSPTPCSALRSCPIAKGCRRNAFGRRTPGPTKKPFARRRRN